MSAPQCTSILHSSFRILFSLALVAITMLAPIAQAQVTTGNLAGDVTTREDGSALPGVTIEAVHVPTGTRYAAVTGGNGRYQIPNVRVGGPYTVTATLEGFQAASRSGISVALGTTAEADLALALAGVSEQITVTATADIIDPSQTGATSEVSTEQIEALPTVNRSLQDYARTNPYFSVDPEDFSSTEVRVAGRNSRYNSIQIDGAVNNDLFGLADTGTPGGQANVQPISVDAIQELQLVVSPYDVRQGGFTGGGMNAITRSGANDFSGSVFGSMRDPNWVGEGPNQNEVADFDHTQYGGRVGGRIIRDQLFFFINGEINDKAQPTGWSVDGSSGNTFDDPNDGGVQQLRDLVQTRYGFDPGSFGDFSAQTLSDQAFVRFDWNIGSANQLTLRHNYVNATRDVWGGRSRSRWTFDTGFYEQTDLTNSTVAQLNSVLSSSMFNEARVSLQSIHDERATPVIFPYVEIGDRPRSGTYAFGTERFSGANSLDQDILEVTDDFTWITGNHTVTIGTHNEFFEFKNLFISEFYGYYFFDTIEDFEAGTATEYRIGFATGDNPKRPTSFEAGQYGLYVNDVWRVNDSLSLNLGLRGDMPLFGDTPSFNQRVFDAIGFSTAETPAEDVVWSPRFGFNWQPGASGNQQLRGGVGIFAGRTPYVWISNAYANTGVETNQLACFGSCTPPTFNPDPFSQPRNLPAGGSPTVDLIDPDFQFPRVLRATLGYDRELIFGVRGTVEALWSQTQEDVYYQNMNLEPTGEVHALDGRPQYRRVSSQVVDALLLTNTSKGEEMTYVLQLHRPFANGVSVSANYAYQDSKSAFDGTSSRAISNWQFHHTSGDIFEPELSRSAFETEHRYNIAATYDLMTGPLSHEVGLFYNAQTGRPFSLLMNSTNRASMNGDQYTTNDLLYVPAAGQVIFQYNDGTTVKDGVTAEEAFGNYLSFLGADPQAGRILDRYEFTEPWSRSLDLHYALGFPIRGYETQLTFDVANLLNMIDENYGTVKFVNNQNSTPVSYRGVDQATGMHIYRENFRGAFEPGSQWSYADTRSRWEARVGVRVSF